MEFKKNSFKNVRWRIFYNINFTLYSAINNREYLQHQLPQSKSAKCFPFIIFPGAETASRSEIENHLELGRELLARGQLSDALSHYHAAVGKSSLTLVQNPVIH